MKKISLPHYYSRSGEKFEPTESFLKSSTVVDTNEKYLKEVGIPVAQIDSDTYATTKDEMHCFVIGETGCGKTRRVILPTIRLMAKTGESMVISDPKGELYRYTADSLKKRGYDVKVLNFRRPRCGNRWNPLYLVEKLYYSEDPENRDKAVMMLDDLISIISSAMKADDDPYWSAAAGNFFRGVSQIILEYGREGDLTFESIAAVARKIYLACDAKTRKLSSSRYDKELEFIDSLGEESVIRQNLSSIIVNAENTRNCIMSIFDNMISMYCNQELLLDLFSKSEIDVAEIGKKPTALFFVLPDDSDAMYPIATYFVKQVYSTLVSLADEQPNGELPNKVTFLLDEFANFAKLPTIHAMLTAARSRKIRFVLVCQSMDQLIEKYQESGMEILLSNCRVWLYMSCRNLPFLQRLEKLAGEYSSPYTKERCPLVSVGTLQHFKMGQVLVLNDRCRPLIGYLDDYSGYDFGEEGFGELSEIPEPHSVEKRRVFSFPGDCRKREPKKESAYGGTMERQGDSLYTEALNRAKECVHKINVGYDNAEIRNELAFYIRHYKLSSINLGAEFGTSQLLLLGSGLKAGNAVSIMNMALYFIESGEYERALTFLKTIQPLQFREIASWWSNMLPKRYGKIETIFVFMIAVAKGKDIGRFADELDAKDIDYIGNDENLYKFMMNDKVSKWLAE